MMTPCFMSAPLIHTDLPMATDSPHRQSAAVAFLTVAATMGGTPTLLNLMDTMFPPQMRQMKTRRAAPLMGICFDVPGLKYHLIKKRGPYERPSCFECESGRGGEWGINHKLVRQFFSFSPAPPLSLSCAPRL